MIKQNESVMLREPYHYTFYNIHEIYWLVSQNTISNKIIYRHKMTYRVPIVFPIFFSGRKDIIIPSVQHPCNQSDFVFGRKMRLVLLFPDGAPAKTGNTILTVGKWVNH